MDNDDKEGRSVNNQSLGDKLISDQDTNLTNKIPVVFRDGIPTTEWLIGEFPRYPSWAIYALGKYFSYSHSSGKLYVWFVCSEV